MKTPRQPLILAAALATALALSACGKSSEPAASNPSTPPPSTTAMTPPMTPPPSATSAMPASAASAAVSFSSVEIGSSVDANNKIRASGTSFAPKDAIYASVETVGSGHATLAAKWTYDGGQTVHEDSKVLDTMGPQTTAFMISKPDGFPAGDYKVEISLNGSPVASKDFSVKK
jgi:ABC-type glycerol-3-phosphate transport system substrate-binding protein